MRGAKEGAGSRSLYSNVGSFLPTPLADSDSGSVSKVKKIFPSLEGLVRAVRKAWICIKSGIEPSFLGVMVTG